MNRLTNRVLKFAAVAAVCGFAANALGQSWTYRNGLLYENNVPEGNVQWVLYVSNCKGTDITIQWHWAYCTYGTSTVLDMRDIRGEDGTTVYNLVEWNGCDPDCRTTVTELILPDSMAVSSGYTFRNFTALERVTLPKAMTFVEQQMFAGCNALKEVKGTVTAAGASMFESCSSLTNLDASGLLTIPSSFCRFCSALKTVKLSDKLESIGGLSFQGTTGLETVEPMFADTLTTVSSTFESKLTGVLRLAQKKPVSICNEAFRNCSFTEVIFGDQLTSLAGYCCFQNIACTKVTFCGARPGAFDSNWLEVDYKVDGKYARRLYLPAIPSWTSCTNSDVTVKGWASCSEAEKGYYTDLFGEDELPDGLVTSLTAGFGFPRNAWIFWYKPASTGEASLLVTATRKLSAAKPYPIYDVTTKVGVGESLFCTNSERTVVGQTLYETKGWALQKLDGADFVDIDSGTGASFSFEPDDDGSYQLVWTVEPIAYRPQVVAPYLPIGTVTTNVTPTMGDGFYAIGETVSYTASPQGDGRFLGWYRNEAKVSDGLTLSFALDGESKLWPHFNTPYWVYEEGVLNDGAWKVATLGGESGQPLIVGNPYYVRNLTAINHSPGVPGPDKLLDLSKTIQGGSTIVGLINSAFRFCANKAEGVKIEELRLPKSLQTISDTVFDHDDGLKRIVFKSCPQIAASAFSSCPTYSMVWDVPGDSGWTAFVADQTKLTPWRSCDQSKWTFGSPHPTGLSVAFGQWVRMSSGMKLLFR